MVVTIKSIVTFRDSRRTTSTTIYLAQVQPSQLLQSFRQHASYLSLHTVTADQLLSGTLIAKVVITLSVIDIRHLINNGLHFSA